MEALDDKEIKLCHWEVAANAILGFPKHCFFHKLDIWWWSVSFPIENFFPNSCIEVIMPRFLSPFASLTENFSLPRKLLPLTQRMAQIICNRFDIMIWHGVDTLSDAWKVGVHTTFRILKGDSQKLRFSSLTKYPSWFFD